MSYHLKAFPILYLNLGGEMMYIIEQRLQAQEITTEKTAKVLNELLSAMLKRQYLNGIFRPGRMSPPLVMKDLIENIVHASIMRLGQDSLDKLYELMVMAVKYQIISACDTESLFALTITHVESWTRLTADPEIMLQIQYAKDSLITHYAKLSSWAWMNIRHSLLNYLQACKTRVTIFLSRGIQSQAGYFHLDLKRPLPHGFVMPKLIGKCKPYENLPCDSQPAVNLGSNMFNEIKPPQVLHTSGFKSLERLIVQTLPTANEPQPQMKTAATETIPTDQNSLQLELKANPAKEQETPKINEETLLDLFDQACLTTEQ